MQAEAVEAPKRVAFDRDGADGGDGNAQIAFVDGDVPADQRDTDADGYGNVCDPDLDNDGQVNFLDLGTMRTLFGQAPGPSCCDGDPVLEFEGVSCFGDQRFFDRDP